MIRRAPPQGLAAHGRADRAALTRINSGLCQDDDADAPEFFHASPSRNDAEILKHGLRPAAGSTTFGTAPRWTAPRVYFALGFTNGVRWQDFVEEQLNEPATLWKVNLTKRQQAALRIDDIAQYEGDSCAFFGTTPIPAEQLQLEQASQGEGTNWFREPQGRANRTPSRIQRLKRAAAWLKQDDPEHFEGGCADISYQLWWITTKMLKWSDVKILFGSARMHARSEAVAHVWLEVDGERFDPTWGRGAWYKGSALTTRRQQIGTLEGLFGVLDVDDAQSWNVQPAELLEILR